MNNNDNIFALSSGHGKSGVAVIRVSGNNLEKFVKKLTGKDTVKPRHAYFTNLKDENGDIIDQCVIIYFVAPHSFTGDDVIEIHSHGAPAVINKIFEYLKLNNMRLATPGEFSRRAFYSGKMDLTDVDGLAALLDAETDVQRKSALRSMMGGDSETYKSWRNDMIEISAYAAAILDYSPDDLPTNIYERITQKTKKLYDDISSALGKYKTARAIRGGVNVVLVGETNVGKSSLFNSILGTARAIVSDTPGTTRDVVSASVDMGGYLVNLADTAGLRETSDTVEKIGINRTHDEIKNADLIIHVITPNDKQTAVSKDELLVVNKCDITKKQEIKKAIYVSAKTGFGVDKLTEKITSKIREITDGSESGLMINARTYELLKNAQSELGNAIEKSNGDYDILSEHLRYAADAIGKILGTISTSDILDATFSQLCLGK
ncbi:MAG: tRNA uridine-5-carboxymethylaminomethyl(34) synthesis GTPase MnmE [Alphaproteobacteria bacterium]|nr:tRNA uridine-5-carboxymethylaminomethyl(34) synthesis GTPase MnmE [Alphaproteobacteria bacterium]